MAYPSDLSRTKDWGTEVLTDSDLEGQFDLIIDWVMAAMNATTGHKHDATSNEGPKINLTTSVTGTLPIANGGTNSTSGFLNGTPVGTISMWMTDTAPGDWLLCYGQDVSKTTYTTLYDVWSTKFGDGAADGTFTVDTGNDYLVITSHGLTAADRITLTTTGTLPGGLDSHTGATGTFTATEATDLINITDHNLVENSTIKFTTTDTLPAGLTAGITYYVRSNDKDSFKVSLTEGGAIVDITDTGTGTHSYHATVQDYYVLVVDANNIQVETSVGGGAIDITSTGTGTHSYHTTFNMPDFRGRFPLGTDDMGGTDAGNISETLANIVGERNTIEGGSGTGFDVPFMAVNIIARYQ